MKLSLAWLCDHLWLNLEQLDVPNLVKRLSRTTAEIENVHTLNLSPDVFELARVEDLRDDQLILKSLNGVKKYQIKASPDLAVNDLLLLITQEEGVRRATLKDLGGSRSDLVPALFIPKNSLNDWRSFIETKDYILEIDNKSINHRPDLWGHRGFAREVAAILGGQLVPEEAILAATPVKQFESQSVISNHDPYGVEINNFSECKRLAGFYFPCISNEASHVFLASRLARLDAKPVSSIVDLTNYVMFDMGQPLHAFDAAKISGKKIVAELAPEKQLLKLLDGSQVELSKDDIIISDGTSALALAGIMGGFESAVNKNTTSVLLEAANFNAHTIRLTSQRVKKRTDASTRFEKKLDPNQNVPAIKRYIKLLSDLGISSEISESIISVGPLAQTKSIEVSLEEIERKLGFAIPEQFATKTLIALGFGVALSEGILTTTVPTYRATDDIEIKEDIIEEVGRFMLADFKEYTLPWRPTAPFDTDVVTRRRLIKRLLANTLSMHEVYNYNLYDAEFLRKLSYVPGDEISLKNPVSEHWQLLVTSLIPHLIKNVVENHNKQDECRFFELAKRWTRKDNQIIEYGSLAGIFWRSTALDFFEVKALLSQFFHGISLEVDWQKGNPGEPWWSIFKTAKLMHEGNVVGFAGMANPEFLSPVLDGQAFFFEFEADFLLSFRPKVAEFKPLAKYQTVTLDVSVFVALSTQVSEIEKLIISVDDRIRSAELIDFYEKEEWGDKRSLTIRFIVQDDTKTLTGQEIEEVLKKVQKKIIDHGGQIR